MYFRSNMESREKRFGNSKYLTIYGVSTSNYSFFEKEMNRHYYILSVSEKKEENWGNESEYTIWQKYLIHA